MGLDILKTSLIACICEGGAETVIMDILLDNGLLIFNRKQLIEGRILPRTSVKDFERRYLRREYEQKIVILRIIDSRREEFNLNKAYRCQVDVINVITAPEIEMLIIAGLNKYKEFCQSKTKKPSEYCKSILKMKNVKSPSFIKKHFGNTNFLLESIEKYHKVHKQSNNEIALFDLLKNKNKR